MCIPKGGNMAKFFIALALMAGIVWCVYNLNPGKEPVIKTMVQKEIVEKPVYVEKKISKPRDEVVEVITIITTTEEEY